MNGHILSLFAALRRARRDRRGIASILLGASGLAVVATAALSVDVGLVLAAHAALQANTNAAALDGAYAWSQAGATATDAQNAATAWYTTHPVPDATITSSTASTTCDTATTGLANCTSSTPNVVVVTQTATVETHFARLVGINSFTISAQAAASRSGGASLPLNVMFILDSTGSMEQSDDTGCTVPGVSRPTKYQCALYGVQMVMKQLLPSQDKVGLMVFPGLSKTFVPCGAYPSPVPYMTTGIAYQIDSSALDNTYNDGAGALVDTSPLVMAVGDNGTSLNGCMSSRGGEGTYYAQVIQEAQAALESEGTPGNQNVIIMLSDGAAAANSRSMSSTYWNNPSYSEKQCAQGVAQAQAAAAAGTWVYAIAYDSPTTSDSSDCPTVNGVADPYTPCTAMQNIASDPTKFFSTASACQLSTSPNTYADVATAFQQVAATLNKPRLVMVP